MDIADTPLRFKHFRMVVCTGSCVMVDQPDTLDEHHRMGVRLLEHAGSAKGKQKSILRKN